MIPTTNFDRTGKVQDRRRHTPSAIYEGMLRSGKNMLGIIPRAISGWHRASIIVTCADYSTMMYHDIFFCWSPLGPNSKCLVTLRARRFPSVCWLGVSTFLAFRLKSLDLNLHELRNFKTFRLLDGILSSGKLFEDLTTNTQLFR